MTKSVPLVVFVTGNAGKLATAREHLSPLGIEVAQARLDLDEIQSTSVHDVAMHKAQQAFRVLKVPLIVEDSGFGIDEMGGWPGPMVKHLVTAVGAAGIAHLADLTRSRACRFTSVLVYIDAHGVPRAFTDEGEPGTIAESPARKGEPGSWSPLWEVFVAPGTSAPLAALAGAERTELFERWKDNSVFARFGQWLVRRTRPEPADPVDSGRLRSADLTFEFPASRIASRPRPAGEDRLLLVDRATERVSHRMADDLPELLPEHSLVVVNNSAVVKAALRRTPDDGTYLHVVNPFHTALSRVTCLCPWKPRTGTSVPIRGGRFDVETVTEPGRDLRTGTIVPDDPAVTTLGEFMARYGDIPIPIYVNAQRDPDASDATDYQNVYASAPGSVACPTAGLHLTESRIKALRAAGHEVAEVTLHIGYGTWRSLASEYVDEHVMDTEVCEINATTLEKLRAAKRNGRPVVAVGTSTVRTLETFSDQILDPIGRESSGPLHRETDLYIAPGYTFRVVDQMLTNFAYPQTPILAMTTAFAGSFDLLRNAYQEAVDDGRYLFLTYGDAMFIR